MSAQEISLLVNQLVVATKSRRKRPSERNLRIYEAARVRNESQFTVAYDNGVSQQRVSSICRQVEAWLRDEEADAPGADDRRRTERWLARRRLEEVHAWSLRGLQASGQTLDTRISFDGGGRASHGQIISKDQTFDVRWLKVAQSSALKLLELNEMPALPEPAKPVQQEPCPRRLAQAQRVIRLVAGLRRLIRKEGTAAALPQVVEQVLRTCLKIDEPQGLTADDPPAAAPLAGSEAACCNYSEPASQNGETAAVVAEPDPAETNVADATYNEPVEASATQCDQTGGQEKTENTTGSPNPPAPWFKTPELPLTRQHHAALAKLTIEAGYRVHAFQATDYLNMLRSRQAAGEQDTGFSPDMVLALDQWQRVLEEGG